MQTHDCEPTLTDTQVLGFCRKGFLVLPEVVSEEINQRTVDYINSYTNEGAHEPTEILTEDWFVENVILNPQAAGAVRSLLGRHFAMPALMSNHRSAQPATPQTWHRDGGSLDERELHYLQVFYYPQDTPLEMGPTEILPGSHFISMRERHMGHYGQIRGAEYTVAPAGTIFLTVYGVWHRRARRTAPAEAGLRHLLKYNYWRTSPPARDWIIEPDFDLARVDYGVRDDLAEPYHSEFMWDSHQVAEMMFWLCGRKDEFNVMGGQGWPDGARPKRLGNESAFGFPGEITDKRFYRRRETTVGGDGAPVMREAAGG